MTIAAMILALLGGRYDADRVVKDAPLFEEAADATGIDRPLLVAVSMKESSLNKRARGADGERGYMQIMDGGQEARRCKGLKWRTSPRDNIMCGARILAFAKRQCGGGPEKWLRQYKGVQGCGPHPYSKRVLRILRMAKAATQ